jgi:hypothetical protein
MHKHLHSTNTPFSTLPPDGLWKLDFPWAFSVDGEALPPAPRPISVEKGEGGSTFLPEVAGGRDVVVPLNPATPKARARARLRMLRRLPKNHDGEGASSPDSRSVDAAIAFLDRLPSNLTMVPTLSSEGDAVIEFSDDHGLRADIAFCARGERLECYWKEPGQPSLFAEGSLSAPAVRALLRGRFDAEL